MNTSTPVLNSHRRAGLALLNSLPKNSVGIEVGVYAGGFSRLIVANVSPSKLYLVDPWQWKAQWFINHTPEEFQTIASGQNTAKGNDLYESVKKLFAASPEVEVRRATSVEAASTFPNEYFDWAFIDGDHRYAAVVDDLRMWWPKIKRGGAICGDDFVNVTSDRLPKDKHNTANGVRFAVDEFIEERGLKLAVFPMEDDTRAHYKIVKG